MFEVIVARNAFLKTKAKSMTNHSDTNTLLEARDRITE